MSTSGLVSSFGAGGFGSHTTIAARRGQRGDIVTLKPHVPPHLEADVIRFGYDEAVRAAALRGADEAGRRTPESRFLSGISGEPSTRGTAFRKACFSPFHRTPAYQIGDSRGTP